MSHHTPNSAQKISYHIIFTGRVQGVGFRFTAQRFAVDLGLTGWVRNTPDGAVELYAEGVAADCRQLVPRLEKHFTIHDIRLSEGAASGAEHSFEIKY